MKHGGNTLIMDCGGGTLKVDFASADGPKVMPNAIMKTKNVRGRIFIGDQIESCNNLSNLFYSYGFQKGYLVNWEIQKQVWDHVLNSLLKVDFSSTNILMTEPYFNFMSIKETMNEVIFEEYQAKGFMRATPAFFAQYKHRQDSKQSSKCCLLVDSGFSFTHIVPVVDDHVVSSGIKRISVGGKILTNHLKDIISYRQLNVMHETHIINQCKEDVCFVSTDFWGDMQTARQRGKANTIVREYVLPDFVNHRRGFVRGTNVAGAAPATGGGTVSAEEYVVRMNNERFAVPELLFHPSDVGLSEMGLTEAVVYALQNLPAEVSHEETSFWDNIHLTGGSAELPGIRDRVFNDIRADAPDDFPVTVTLAKNPMTAAWHGGRSLAADTDSLERYLVTKAEYEEHGHSICHRRFGEC